MGTMMVAVQILYGCVLSHIRYFMFLAPEKVWTASSRTTAFPSSFPLLSSFDPGFVIQEFLVKVFVETETLNSKGTLYHRQRRVPARPHLIGVSAPLCAEISTNRHYRALRYNSFLIFLRIGSTFYFVLLTAVSKHEIT
jgi:hypothetical protein